MALSAEIYRGVIRPSLVRELQEFRCPGYRVSSYYLDVDFKHLALPDAVRIKMKSALEEIRPQIDHFQNLPGGRELHQDWVTVRDLVLDLAGLRRMRGLACFVSSFCNYARIFALPWPVRTRCFLEESFVLWPLELVLDQAERYCVCLTDKDEARIFLYYLDQIEEYSYLFHRVPGRIRYPDPFGELQYMRKHVESFHHHFDQVAHTVFRLFREEPFDYLIIGGLWETLPQFEDHLHSYLKRRITARWHLPVDASISEVLERTRVEEELILNQQALELWQAIQEAGPKKVAFGPEEAFRMLWQQRVHSLLVDPTASLAGYQCVNCRRLTLNRGSCPECGSTIKVLENTYPEALAQALDQSAQVRFLRDHPPLISAGSIAVLLRY